MILLLLIGILLWHFVAAFQLSESSSAAMLKSYRAQYAEDAFGNFIEAPKNWYYRFFGVRYKERFFLSATLLQFIANIESKTLLLNTIRIIIEALIVSVIFGEYLGFAWVFIVDLLMQSVISNLVLYFRTK